MGDAHLRLLFVLSPHSEREREREYGSGGVVWSGDGWAELGWFGRAWWPCVELCMAAELFCGNHGVQIGQQKITFDRSTDLDLDSDLVGSGFSLSHVDRVDGCESAGPFGSRGMEPLPMEVWDLSGAFEHAAWDG